MAQAAVTSNLTSSFQAGLHFYSLNPRLPGIHFLEVANMLFADINQVTSLPVKSPQVASVSLKIKFKFLTLALEVFHDLVCVHVISTLPIPTTSTV